MNTHVRLQFALKRSVSALLVILSVGATFIVIPQQASAARAGATSDRTVEVLASCSPTSVSLGSTATCTGSVRYTETGGTKTVPQGTVALTVDSGRIGIITACTLAYVSTANQSECSFKIVNLSNGNGEPVLKFNYTPAADDTHATNFKEINLNFSGSTFKQHSESSLSAGTPGTSLRVFTVGCASSSTRYIGVFLSTAGDPATSGQLSEKVWEGNPETDGSYDWTTALEADHPTGTFYVRFYCADASPASYTDTSVLATSPLYTYVVSSAAMRGASLQAVTANSAPSGTFTADPEDTSGIDTELIPGAQMITLKQRVDAALPLVSRVDRLSQAFLGKIPPRSFVDLWVKNFVAGRTDAQLVAALATRPEYFWSYALLTPAQFVDRAYFVLLGRAPTTNERLTLAKAISTGKQSRQAALAAIASSPEHIIKTANRSYVTAAYQALTPTMPTQANLAQYTGELNDRGPKVAMLENLALSRSTFENWIAAITTSPATSRF
ncbi:MAG: hypothetical protein NTX58_13075 [Actinobacteria bacterium]|nr:hypothetical protein [Actinomycetota bacterium]